MNLMRDEWLLRSREFNEIRVMIARGLIRMVLFQQQQQKKWCVFFFFHSSHSRMTCKRILTVKINEMKINKLEHCFM